MFDQLIAVLSLLISMILLSSQAVAAAAVMPDNNGGKLLIAPFICLIMAVSVLCSSCVTGLPSWSLYWES